VSSWAQNCPMSKRRLCLVIQIFRGMQCGAIPIVEESAEAYEAFTYHTMTDATYHWSPELALANYELCRSRITIPREELNAAIPKLLIQ